MQSLIHLEEYRNGQRALTRLDPFQREVIEHLDGIARGVFWILVVSIASNAALAAVLLAHLI